MSRKLLKIIMICIVLIVPFSPAEAVPYPNNTEIKQIVCLAKNIYYEARGEPEKGRIAVGYVVMNRKNVTNKNICQVIYESHQTNKHILCQFSWVCDRKLAPINDYKSWNEALHIAEIFILAPHRLPPDPTKGAVYYQTVKTHKIKSKIYKKTIGKHKFYTEPVSLAKL